MFSYIYITITFRDSRLHSCSRTFCFHKTFLYFDMYVTAVTTVTQIKSLSLLIFYYWRQQTVIVTELYSFLISLPCPPRQEKSNSHSNAHLYSAKYSGIEMKEIKFCHNIQSLNVQLLFYQSIYMYVYIYIYASTCTPTCVCVYKF